VNHAEAGATRFPDAVLQWLAEHDFGPVRAQPLAGGAISTVTLLSGSRTPSLVLKRCADPVAGMYRREAGALATLADAGHLRVPAVRAFGVDFLLLDYCGIGLPSLPGWMALARALATQHRNVTGPAFGFGHDGFLGRLRQDNTWCEDGHEFFARYRMLRYLTEPLVSRTLGAGDIRRVERLAGRLPQLVPPQPPSLVHGDLWHANVLGDGRAAAVIDPACYYGWAEAELSMLYSCGNVPERFWSAYQEIYPLQPGWRDRMSLLNVRELLSMVAHFGDSRGSAGKLRSMLSRFS
jgi:fructosamine-3-kinase